MAELEEKLPTTNQEQNQTVPEQPKTDGQPVQTEQEPSPAEAAQQAESANLKVATPGQQSAKETKKHKPKRPPLKLDFRSQVMIVGFLLVLLGGQVAFFYTFNKETKTKQALLEQARIQSEDQNSLLNQIDDYEADVSAVQQAFPDEVGLSNFVRVVNKYLQGYDEGRLQFDTKEPVILKTVSTPLLPLTITATTEISKFQELLTNLANSPYLFQPLSMQIARVPETENKYKIVLKGRLYVDESLK